MAVIQGRAFWSFVTTPNTRYEPAYCVNLLVDEETASKFRAEGFSVKDLDEGPTIIFKRKVNGPNGMIRQAPKLFDKSKREVDVTIGNGSVVKVQYKPWESKRNGVVYKGLDFQAMQILDLVEYNAPDGAEFESVTEGDDEL